MQATDSTPGLVVEEFADEFRFTMVCLHVGVICVGSVGFICVLVVILADASLWKAGNVLIANLALTDLLQLIVTGPIHIYIIIVHPAEMEECIYAEILRNAFMCTSFFSVVVIAVNRYILVCCSVSVYKRVFNFRSVTAICLALWGSGWLWQIDDLLFIDDKYMNQRAYHGCNIPSNARFTPRWMAVAIVFVVSYLLVVVLYYRVARRATRYSRRHLQGERLSQAGYRNSLEAYLSGSSMAIFHRTSGGSLPGLPSEPQNQTRDSFDLPAVKVPPWKPSSHEQDVKRATPGAGNSRERRHVMRDQGTGAEHASAAKMHQNAPRRSHPEKTPSHPPKKTSALMIPQLSKTSNDSRSAVFPKISLQRPSLESLGQHTLNLSILSTDSGQTVGTEKFKHHRSLGAAAKVSGSEYYATGTCKRYAPARQRRRGHAVARDPADASTAFARDPADASTAFARDPADASTISGHGAINEQGTTSGHSTVSGHRFELSSSLPRKDMRRSFVACTLTMATYLPYTLLLMASHTFSLPVGEENYVVAQWAVLLAASLNCFVYGYLNANYRMAASKLMGKARNRRRTIPQTTQKRSAETQIEIRGEIVEETVKD